MEASISAPLLRQIKSWQLFCFGISGWIALYSTAIINWSSSSFVASNAQGGSFAAVMALAGREVKRLQKGSSDLLQWAGGISAEQLNLALTKTLQKSDLCLEALHPVDAELGFGMRAVKAGRTFLFETGRWQESVIDILHAKTTDQNRSLANADVAVIVGAGTPDKDTKIYAGTNPVKLLVGEELKAIFSDEGSPVKTARTGSNPASALSLFGTRENGTAFLSQINSITQSTQGAKSTPVNENPAATTAKPPDKSPGAPARKMRVRWY